LLLAIWPKWRFSFPGFVSAIAFSWLLLVAVRAIAQRIIDEDIFKRRVLVFGAGLNAARLARLRRRADQRGFKILGFVPAGDEDVAVSEDRLVRFDGRLFEYARENGVEEIVVAMDDRRRNFPLKELLDCRLAGIRASSSASR
jgi:hypothetical protein